MDVAKENETFIFIWKIENFSLLTHKIGEFISSPEFQIKWLEEAKFYLRLFPRGKESEENVCCALSRSAEDDGPEFTESFQLELSSVISKVPVKSIFVRRAKMNSVSEGLLISREEICENEEVFLPNDILTIQCKISKEPKQSDVSTKCYAKSKVQMDRHTFSVPFPKLSNISELREKIREFTFTIPLKCQSQLGADFKINLCFQNWNTYDEKLEVAVQKQNLESIFVVCKISLENSDESCPVLTHEKHLFLEEEADWNISTCLEELKTYSRNDKISLLCEFTLSDGTVTHDTVTYPPLHRNMKLSSKISNSVLLRNMYEEKKFSDLTLIAEDNKFLAHKCVLCAQSPVFKAMFENDMKEKQTSSVEIRDISANVLGQMLDFIYMGFVNDITQADVLHLYTASDKYQILDLKECCRDFLVDNMTVENVCDVLELADLHEDNRLKESARVFIRLHAKVVFRAKEWKAFMEKKLELAADIMHSLCIEFTDAL